MNPKHKFAWQVNRYRQTGKEYIKKGLPHATISAVCKNGRKRSDVTRRNGWIALDIDSKDNPGIDAVYLRDQISKIIYVAFAGLSVSGKGVWALVKVADPQNQGKYFQQLQQDFKSKGIILDSTKGKNPNDARFYSLDPKAYIANDFKIYDRLPEEKPINAPSTIRVSHTALSTGKDTQSRVEVLISKIQASHIDITDGYENWRSLGFALESEFGESGRDYFHTVSQNHPDYTAKETDREYTDLLEHGGKGISIGTFFYKCKKFGVMLYD